MMVNPVLKKIITPSTKQDIKIPKEDVRWTTVSLSEILDRGKRIEASTFNIDRKHAVDLLNNSPYKIVELSSPEGGLIDCYYGHRAKRNYLTVIDEFSLGFLGSAEMLDINPNPVKFIAPDNPMAEKLKLKKGMILVSRSGTIGNVTLVGDTLQKYIVSEHAIRIEMNENPGYVYAYLKTDIAQNLLHAEKHGSVILEIEPSSLKSLSIPDAPYMLKKQIHDIVMESYRLRDESNDLMDQATKILIEELELPSIEVLEQEAFSHSKEMNSFTTKLSDLNSRLEGSYHIPLVEVIENHISRKAKLVSLGDSKITEKIILPGRFKRVYVEKGNGQVFVGGKEIGQLDPSNKKYLSLVHHSDRIKRELFIKENMVLVTCSGTIGKVAIVPKHWADWTVNQHVLRVKSKPFIVGLIYTWLNSDYGKVLITRHTYGSVVNELTDQQIAQVNIPLLNSEDVLKQINKLVLKANQQRYEAYKLEKRALEIMNSDVLGL